MPVPVSYFSERVCVDVFELEYGRRGRVTFLAPLWR
jgi:hypothetical protein